MRKPRRIGANEQRQLDARKHSYASSLFRKSLSYLMYFMFGAIIIYFGWLLFTIVILLDPSNPYMH